MRRILTLLTAILLVATGASAQKEDIRKAAERYKSANTLIANVTRTHHNAAVTKDDVARGHFYYYKPNKMSMVFKSANEMLLASGNTFSMVKGGRLRTTKAKGKGNNPFETLKDVFTNMLSADDNAKLSDMADVKVDKQGNNITITITPVVKDEKARRRLMFTSCVAVIDLKAAELRRLRINERGSNYTQYDFSNYVFNAEVSPSVFDTRTVM